MNCECRYDIPPTTAGDVLEIVKNAVSEYQIQRPALYGDLMKTVASVGVGGERLAQAESGRHM